MDYVICPGIRHHPFIITEEQQSNLEKLAAYLEELPTDYRHFNMSYFFLEQGRYDVYIHENHFAEKIKTCGAVACMVGHGPLAGIPEDKENDASWNSYARRVFGSSISTNHGHFLFSGLWESINNTPIGGARRIRYALQHGFVYNIFDDDNYKRVMDHIDSQHDMPLVAP